MTIQDGFAVAVALAVEDGTATGFSSDPSKRKDVFRMFGVQVQVAPPADADPMNTPPPAHLAEEQLAEFRAMMSGGKPPNPAND